jgi:Flp pilus assembly protein TadD
MPSKDYSIFSPLRSAVTALVMTICCATAVLATPAEDAYQQGKDLVEKEDFKGAIVSLNEAISLDPKNADAFKNRGFAYGSLMQHQKAIDDCTKAIGLDPKYVKATADLAISATTPPATRQTPFPVTLSVLYLRIQTLP